MRVGDSVSVVIPTHKRAKLVLGAVESARAQTAGVTEIIVVVDGHDPATEEALAGVPDPRVRMVVNPEPLGPGAARNAGVAAATGDWIAFLDDDDAWKPTKIAAQLDAAARSGIARPVVSCRCVMQEGDSTNIWPKRLPGPGEHVSDYLIDRPGPFSRPGYVATPTILVPRDLAREVPMPSYRSFEDWGWLLSVLSLPGTGLVFAEEALCLVDVGTGRPSLHAVDNWRGAFDWARAHRHLMTRNAYAAFLSTTAAGMARRQRAWAGLRELFVDMMTHGKPQPKHLAMFFGTCFLTGAGHRLVRAIARSDGLRAEPQSSR